MIPSFGDTFEELFVLQRGLDARLASNWMEKGTAGAGAYPPINIFQKEDDLVVILELPGIDKKDLEIQAKENTIRISGRKAINYDEGASMHRRERVWGVFDRTISVPIQIAPNGIKAEYRDGVLALFIPRAEGEKPRTIPIK